jgi:hypothetical protein
MQYKNIYPRKMFNNLTMVYQLAVSAVRALQ